jgi:hypothetical protein
LLNDLALGVFSHRLHGLIDGFTGNDGRFLLRPFQSCGRQS